MNEKEWEVAQRVRLYSTKLFQLKLTDQHKPEYERKIIRAKVNLSIACKDWMEVNR